MKLNEDVMDEMKKKEVNENFQMQRKEKKKSELDQSWRRSDKELI